MGELENLIIGNSETLDVYVLVRIIVIVISVELVSNIMKSLGGLNK